MKKVRCLRITKQKSEYLTRTKITQILCSLVSIIIVYWMTEIKRKIKKELRHNQFEFKKSWSDMEMAKTYFGAKNK